MEKFENFNKQKKIKTIDVKPSNLSIDRILPVSASCCL